MSYITNEMLSVAHDILAHSDDELYHYGRKGMKWGENIFANNPITNAVSNAIGAGVSKLTSNSMANRQREAEERLATARLNKAQSDLAKKNGFKTHADYQAGMRRQNENNNRNAYRQQKIRDKARNDFDEMIKNQKRQNDPYGYKDMISSERTNLSRYNRAISNDPYNVRKMLQDQNKSYSAYNKNLASQQEYDAKVNKDLQAKSNEINRIAEKEGKKNEFKNNLREIGNNFVYNPVTNAISDGWMSFMSNSKSNRQMRDRQTEAEQRLADAQARLAEKRSADAQHKREVERMKFDRMIEAQKQDDRYGNKSESAKLSAFNKQKADAEANRKINIAVNTMNNMRKSGVSDVEAAEWLTDYLDQNNLSSAYRQYLQSL